MARHGSATFEAYTRNLRRLYWAEFVDAQLSAERNAHFRASLVSNPLPEKDNLVNAYDYHRHRTTAGD